MPLLNVLATLFILATGTTTTVGPDAWSAVLQAITSQISVTSVMAVVASVVTAGIGFVFMWWGVRKLASSIMAAFRSGKLRF